VPVIVDMLIPVMVTTQVLARMPVIKENPRSYRMARKNPK
jgi:hypothetical protein